MEEEKEDMFLELLNELLGGIVDDPKVAEIIESLGRTPGDQKIAALAELLRGIDDQKINEMIGNIEAVLRTDEQKMENDFIEHEDFIEPEDFILWQNIEPQLIRRMNAQYPPLPDIIMYLIRKPQVLWRFMQKLAFDSTEKVQRFLNSKHAIRSIFWKADLTAMFGCYDATCLLKHAAMRLIRNDLKSASHLYKVAMAQVLRKMIDDTKKKKKKKIKTREVLSETEIIPISYRKHRRNNKKIGKVKSLMIHYLYSDRTLIKKPFRVTDDKFKNAITEIAFSDPEYCYPRKKFHVEDIVNSIDLSDYEDEDDDFDYEFLKSDDDNKYLKADISRILRKENLDIIHSNQYDLHNLRDNSASQNDNGKSYTYVTKLRIENFFRHFDCPQLESMMVQYLNSNKLKDWIGEVDLSVLVNDIENYDKSKQPISQSISFDEDYFSPFPSAYVPDPSEKEKELYAELRKEYLSLINPDTEENNEQCEERNNDTEENNEQCEERNNDTEENNEQCEERNNDTEENNELCYGRNNDTEENNEQCDERNNDTEEDNEQCDERNNDTEEDNEQCDERNIYESVSGPSTSYDSSYSEEEF